MYEGPDKVSDVECVKLLVCDVAGMQLNGKD